MPRPMFRESFGIFVGSISRLRMTLYACMPSHFAAGGGCFAAAQLVFAVATRSAGGADSAASGAEAVRHLANSAKATTLGQVMRLGIDFGTTRTVVAAAVDGRYPVVSFES